MFVYCCIIVFAFQSQCETGLIKLRSGWEQGWGAAPELGALMGSAFGGTRADEDDACINDRLCPLKGKALPTLYCVTYREMCCISDQVLLCPEIAMTVEIMLIEEGSILGFSLIT